MTRLSPFPLRAIRKPASAHHRIEACAMPAADQSRTDTMCARSEIDPPRRSYGGAIAGDLRRARGGPAEVAEVIVQRASLLDPDERDLLLSVYRDGVAVARLARAATVGQPERADTDLIARTLRRRVRQLVARVMDPRFVFAAALLAGRPGVERRFSSAAADSGGRADPSLAPREAVAHAVFIRGLSQREAARALALSLHQVRTELAVIEALFLDRRERTSR